MRTRLSGDSAVEISRKSRASSRIDVDLVLDAAPVLAALARHLGVQEDDVQQREHGDEAGVAGEQPPPPRAGAVGPKQSTASKPIAVAASGSPTTRRWKVTRKLTTA